MGLPFIGLLGLMGSDFLRKRPDFKVIEDPFRPGHQAVVAEAIRPDVAVFQALRADPEGNAVLAGKQESPVIAQASKRVVVTAEEIVDRVTAVDAAAGRHTFLPAMDVDLVAHAPWGAHPGGLPPAYERDDALCQAYVEAAQDPDRFAAYLDRFIFSVPTHAAYLERVGLASGASA
jgi:glutaconate CoA-transferase subunit A